MTLETIINGLGLVSTCVCLLLVAFLLSAKSKIRTANLFLAGFLFLTAIDLSSWFTYVIVPLPAPYRMLRTTLGFLQMPLFLGYFASVSFGDLKPRAGWSLHLLPFILATLLLLPRVYLGLWGGTPAPISRSSEFLVIEIGLEAQYYAYAIGVALMLQRFRALFLERYSGAQSQTIVWLTQLLAVSFAAHSLVAVKTYMILDNFGDKVLILEWIVAGTALSVTVWITLKALRHPDLFRGIDGRLKRVAQLPDAMMDTADEDMRRLKAFMEKEAPYVDPDLSLEMLAKKLQVSPRNLSVLINHHMATHFFDFINSFRIARAKALLRTPAARSNLTFVMLESGFNSKSSFNTAFRKHAGMTPSQYRKLQTEISPETSVEKKRPTS
ncbi:helix-turn-helix transcriptional regulator [Asticcacaulis sp. 201]|uniref:helix-turn-helix domain-containing protein n=1 Tax=Asticcacaulis sp. 201 TaxID=3028787 RepID=UPI0029168441|nr:helix-turn-helix transcriptional regulator [Asticcacaulis sp. 201]MDV6331146.1 helix-turn-helix transcriptional regulator [Asticcacaulis sp. 201]